MHSILIALGLLVPSPLFPNAVGQDPAVGPAQPGKAAAVEDSKTSIFGEPLYVDGKRVTDDEIKLHLIYGAGRVIFELARLNVIVDDELARRAGESAEAEIARREAEKPFASPDARKAALATEVENQKKLLMEKYEPSEAQIQREIERMVTDFRKNYPALDLDTEIRRAFRNLDWYHKQIRTQIRFEKVFLPDNPDEWPVLTKEAMRADSGELLIDDAYQSYQTRLDLAEQYNKLQLEQAEAAKASGQEFTPDHVDIMPEDPMYMEMLRDIVKIAVYKLCEFRTSKDGLPSSTALWADTNGDGNPELVVSTDTMWDEIKGTITQNEIDEAKQWFVTSIATRDRLEKDGFLLSDDDCTKVIQEKAAPLAEGMYGMESAAMQHYFFPSLESYLEYVCLLEGFTKMKEPDLRPGPANELPQVLRDYYDRANRVMGLGQVDVEVLLVGAFDIGRYQWKLNGWEWAKNKAAEIRKEIDDNLREYNEQRAKILEAKARNEEYVPEKEILEPYRFWSQMMDDHSEYWDPPAPNDPKKRMSMVGMKMKGRFGPHYRNDLNNYVGETYYSDWVTGRSITDYVFFEQAEGTVAGPFRGPQGYYITRLLRRSPPTRSLNLSEPVHRELLQTDWLRWKFNQYTREAVEQADVKGFQRDL